MAKPLTFAEIRARLDAFVVEWRGETSERAESQSFWNELLTCSGVQRRRVALFEQRATRASTGNTGRIDIFWPKVVIGEHKSVGAMTEDSAEIQAEDFTKSPPSVAEANASRALAAAAFPEQKPTSISATGQLRSDPMTRAKDYGDRVRAYTKRYPRSDHGPER